MFACKCYVIACVLDLIVLGFIRRLAIAHATGAGVEATEVALADEDRLAVADGRLDGKVPCAPCEGAGGLEGEAFVVGEGVVV